jgi:hypothetical protein
MYEFPLFVPQLYPAHLKMEKKDICGLYAAHLKIKKKKCAGWTPGA